MLKVNLEDAFVLSPVNRKKRKKPKQTRVSKVGAALGAPVRDMIDPHPHPHPHSHYYSLS